MRRVDSLNENELAAEIGRLESDLDALKSGSQRVGSSVKFFQNTTGDPYDWEGTLPPEGVMLRVTAVAQNMAVLFALPYVKLYTSPTYDEYTPQDYYEDAIAGIAGIAAVPRETTAPGTSVPPANTRVFSIYLTGDTTSRTARVKVYVRALDECTVTVVQEW